MDIKQTVVSLVSSKAVIPGDTESQRLACDFFREGLLDSVKFVELVAELEEVFGVMFSHEDMESEKFRCMGGLIEIITRLCNQGK